MMNSADAIERYAPERPFPPYAFVPGRHPHPVTDPQGHRFGQTEEAPPVPKADQLTKNPHFRFGLDLFNHGYYWEAHEVWEGLWLACGREGKLADVLKGLIRLAAAGVKAREGNANGVIRHARRAEQLFSQTGCGELRNMAEHLAANPPCDARFTTAGCPVLMVRLRLEDFTGFQASFE